MLERPWEYSKMAGVESTLWWYRALHHLTLVSIEEHFGSSRNITIIDAGCGTGGLMDHLRRNGYGNISGFDLSPDAVTICEARSLKVFRDDLMNISRHYTAGHADVIISNDNFYFLSESQRKAVADDFYKILKPGGIVIMNLPALKIFSGIHDMSVGVTYRFDKRDIPKIFDERKFKAGKILYWPFLLSPLILLGRLVQKIKLKFQKQPEIKSDISVPPLWLNSLLFDLTRLENTQLPFKPWGSSLFLVMKKESGDRDQDSGKQG